MTYCMFSSLRTEPIEGSWFEEDRRRPTVVAMLRGSDPSATVPYGDVDEDEEPAAVVEDDDDAPPPLEGAGASAMEEID